MTCRSCFSSDMFSRSAGTNAMTYIRNSLAVFSV